MSIQLKTVRLYFNVLSSISPRKAGKSAFELFQKVRKKSIRPRENNFFESAKHYKIDSEAGEIDCYRLGEDDKPTVLLVHGWDSNAGSLSKIAFELVEKGYQILTFNLPGHAFAKKSKTNLHECRLALTAVIDHAKLENGFSIISHSFGSAVVAYTIRNLNIDIDKLIFLTNPNKVEDIFTEFKRMIGLGDKAYNEMLRLTESIIAEPISAVSVQENLKSASFNKLLLVHDEFDRVLPYINSLKVHENTPKSELLRFENIGHYKMLWKEEVVETCVNYISS